MRKPQANDVEKGENNMDEKAALLSQQKSTNTPTKSVATNDEETDDTKSGATLAIAFLSMLFFQLGNRIFGRLQTYPMHNYPLFLNLMGVAIYIPVCYAYCLPVMMYTNWITKEQKEIPKYKFAVMGAYDSLAGIMQTFAVNYISNASMIVLVQQSAIPISMVISTYALKSIYTKAQYMGAAVVMFGIVVVLVPNFFNTPAVTTTESSDSAHSAATVEMIWLLVMVVSCVPMVLSSVYKEKALGETDIDVIYLNYWVSVFQFLIAIPLCIPSSLLVNFPLSQILPNLYNGMFCWLGYNGVTAENNPYNLPLDDCSAAPLYVTMYLVFNLIYNFLIIVILKIGSSNILWMASTVIVPLSNVAFSLEIMPGHQPMRTWDIIGLFVIMIGLVIYRFSNELLAYKNTLLGIVSDEKEDTKEHAKMARKIAKESEGKQLKYLGLNQTEFLQTLVETRVKKDQVALFPRSPAQIRGRFFTKIGVSPSPMISMGPGKRLTVDQEQLSAARATYQTTGIASNGYGSLERASSFRSPSGPMSPKSSKNTKSAATATMTAMSGAAKKK